MKAGTGSDIDLTIACGTRLHTNHAEVAHSDVAILGLGEPVFSGGFVSQNPTIRPQTVVASDAAEAGYNGAYRWNATDQRWYRDGDASRYFYDNGGFIELFGNAQTEFIADLATPAGLIEGHYDDDGATTPDANGIDVVAV